MRRKIPDRHWKSAIANLPWPTAYALAYIQKPDCAQPDYHKGRFTDFLSEAFAGVFRNQANRPALFG